VEEEEVEGLTMRGVGVEEEQEGGLGKMVRGVEEEVELEEEEVEGLTVRGVEEGGLGMPGRGSADTCIEAPVVSLISLILPPSLPMMAPHWLEGTSRLRCRSRSSPSPLRSLPCSRRSRSSRSSRILQISVYALNMESVGPSTVTILSCGLEPSMRIFAPDSSLMELTTSPPRPMTLPASGPVTIVRRVIVTLGLSSSMSDILDSLLAATI